ncbi:hypothetical protein [Bosea sp. AS-1]|uniref:hypothetical protein n=1 Tax=Bosea sp. AS-1 TaxID=2015316 RepID=UPI0020BECF53|nr:hypothetical protein [Bosea sp. AS-1]
MTENTPRFQLLPLTDERDEIKAMAISIMGFRFMLPLEAPDPIQYPFLAGARYRPSRILVSYPESTNWLTLSWEDDGKHEELTVQWFQPR